MGQTLGCHSENTEPFLFGSLESMWGKDASTAHYNSGEMRLNERLQCVL